MSKKLLIITFILVSVYCTFFDTINIEVGESVQVSSFENTSVQNEEYDYVRIDNNKPLTIKGKEIGKEKVTLFVKGVPYKQISVNVNDKRKLTPVGVTVGVRVNSKGILILGTGEITDENGEIVSPMKNLLSSGDVIYKVDGKNIENKEQLQKEIEQTKKDTAVLTVLKNGKVEEIKVPINHSEADGKNKLGLWVRDSSQGVGTITYVDETTGQFGGLGHGIIDIDTQKLMDVKKGEIYVSDIIKVNKGKRGVPGELIGEITTGDYVGKIFSNSIKGIFGKIEKINKITLQSEPLELASYDDIQIGDAYIYCNILNKDVQKYKIKIEKIDFNNKNNKNFVIKVVDEKLLSQTSGIVQGMSGSPIIQNGKFVGAVTHVYVNDPTKGNGIYIKNMIDQ